MKPSWDATCRMHCHEKLAKDEKEKLFHVFWQFSDINP